MVRKDHSDTKITQLKKAINLVHMFFNTKKTSFYPSEGAKQVSRPNKPNQIRTRYILMGVSPFSRHQLSEKICIKRCGSSYKVVQGDSQINYHSILFRIRYIIDLDVKGWGEGGGGYSIIETHRVCESASIYLISMFCSCLTINCLSYKQILK